MMERQQKGRAGLGRLARKLGPALGTSAATAAAVAAALIVGSCTGKPSAPAAGLPGAGVVVAATDRREAAGRSEGALTTESAVAYAPQAKQAPATADSRPRETTPAVTPIPSATPIAVKPTPTATTALVASSTRAPAPWFVVVANANVRGGPGTAYPVIGGLAAGQTYSVAARNQDGSWLEFHYGNATGWISTPLVNVSVDAATLPVAAHIPPPPSPTKASRTQTPALGSSDPKIADLIGRINKARTDAGLSGLRWTPELAQAAGAHTWDMATHHFFDHTGSDGADVTIRMRRAGYIPMYWGEILTHVNGGGGPDAAFSQFWNSPHHHDIILGDKFTDIGAAWIRDPADGSFNYYAVEFGTR